MDDELHPRSVTGRQLVVDVASNFGVVRLKVTGASMIPAIWPGDVIIVRTALAQLQPGQIVLYRREGMLIAHRITRIHGKLLTTQGDSLPNEDPPVNEADIVGLVVGLLRNGNPMDLKQSQWQCVSASILRRSDFCMRMALRLGRRVQGFASREISWAP
jgi:signal peptidase